MGTYIQCNVLQLEPAAAKYKSRASCCKVTAASKFIVLQHYVYYVYVNPFKQSGVSVLGGPLSVLQSLAALGDPTAARILLNTTEDFVGCSYIYI